MTNTTTNATTNAAALTLEQRNANARKTAMQAAKTAVLELYAKDRIAFLHAVKFDAHDKAYTEKVEYTAERYNTDGKLEKFTAAAVLRVSLFDFVQDKDSRATVKDRTERLADMASDSAKESRAAAVPLIANLCTLVGMHECAEKVNERDAKRILRAAYTVSDKNDDTAREREIKRAVCAMLWAMTEKHETANAYRAAKAAAKAAAEQKAAQAAANKAAQKKAANDAKAAAKTNK